MRITYLDHSGFAVELEQTLLVFDECNPKSLPGAAGLAAGVVEEATVRAYPNSFLFFSHSHGDHCCREAAALPFSHILLGDDFPQKAKGRRVHEGETLNLDGVSVSVFGSTDQGVSFLVEAEGRRIFHAGDFNLWHWEEESTKEEIAEAEQGFARILQTLLPFADTLDAAFFPVDPRMGKNTARGAEQFLAEMRPKVLIPMHLWGDAAEAQAFAAQHPQQVRLLTERGQSMEI